MLDPLVTITDTRSVTGIDPRTLLPMRVTQWTFTIGPNHGPYVRTTPDAEFTAQYVEDETNKVLKTLRDLGVIKSS